MTENIMCWNCGYLGNYTGLNFVQDFTCKWFQIHKNEEPKKLYPKKKLAEGCKFWKERKAVSEGMSEEDGSPDI